MIHMSSATSTSKSSDNDLDIAGKAHWDATWSDGKIPEPHDPRSRNPRNHATRQFDDFFRQAFRERPTHGQRLLEVGCARSRWLPYFAQNFGFEVAGLDYSESGCEQAKAIADRAGIACQIVKGDMFEPPPGLVRSFDVVVSFGLVEHFRDTASAVSALAHFARPGGLILTFVPNMRGLTGALQRWGDNDVYTLHVPLDATQLANAHKQAGCENIASGYLMTVNMGVPNISMLKPGRRTRLKRAIFSALRVGTGAVWAMNDLLRWTPTSAWSSPYVYATGILPRDQDESNVIQGGDPQIQIDGQGACPEPTSGRGESLG
jgi:2-polyprenyl-3-methyl-5-hydroxy-6-metoxy-1,4-benzoquinol methylase